MAKLWTVKKSDGKGEGVFATQDIPAGTVIMHDHPIMSFYSTQRSPTSKEIKKLFKGLSQEQQRKFLNLHEGHRPLSTKLLRIYKANTFEVDRGTVILLDASKLNHSCVPNVERTDTIPGKEGKDLWIVTVKPVAKGDEILIRYIGEFDFMTRQQRQKWLRLYYGFECTCPACSLVNDNTTHSDTRRRIINVLRSGIGGRKPMDLSVVDGLAELNSDTLCGPQLGEPLETLLSHQERCAYWICLGGVLEAEGLVGIQFAECWNGAGIELLRQMYELTPIYILASAEHMVSYWTKATAIVQSVYGTASEEYKRLKRRTTMLLENSCPIGLCVDYVCCVWVSRLLSIKC